MEGLCRYAEGRSCLELDTDVLEAIGVGVPTLTKLLLELKAKGLNVRTDLIELHEIKDEILRALSEREEMAKC